jgi:hypothetical protein
MLAVGGPTHPDDSFQIVREEKAPLGGHDVWVNAAIFDADAGRRVSMEARCRLIQSDGWKVEDFILTSFDGQTAVPPISVAKEYHRMFPNSSVSKPGSESGSSSRAGQKVVALGLLAWIKSGGAKVVGLAVIGFIAAIATWARRGGRREP